MKIKNIFIALLALCTVLGAMSFSALADDDVINVNATNAQDYLDGKYGSIDGKTINFTENIKDILDLARPTKYQGSNTTYYKYDISIPGPEANSTEWSDNISTVMISHSHYYRTLNNVTFTANEGVTVAGFTFSAGHVASSGYDYVRDVELTSGVTYYKHSNLNNIKFDGLTITGNFSALLYLGDCTVNNVTFDGCTFTGATDTQGSAAIRFLADNQYFNGVTVNDCNINDYYQGIYIAGANGVNITGNTITDITHNAIALQSESNPVEGSVSINNNYIKNVKDRVIRFNDIDAATIAINNNVMVNCGDEDGQIIKATSVADDANVDLEYNYWDGKATSVAVSNLTAPTSVGVTNAQDWDVDVSNYTATACNVAWIDNTYYYTTLDAAVTAIENGETATKEITFLADMAFSNREAGIETDTDGVIFDLNGHTLTLGGDHVYTTDVTFKNGNIEITDEKAGTGVFWMWNANNTLTFENVNFSNAGDSINACGVFAAAPDSVGVTPTPDTGDFVFKNCNINLTNNTFNPDAGANLFYFQDTTSEVKFEGGSITIDSFARVFQYGDYDIDDARIEITNLNGNVMRRANAVITNTVLNAHGTENGIKLDGTTGNVVVDGTSVVTLTGAKDYDLVVNGTSTLDVAPTAVLYAGKSNITNPENVTGNAILLGNKVYVQYAKTDIDAAGADDLEGADTYSIVLAAMNAEKINELASADITFDFDGTPYTGAAMTYTVTPTKGVTLTQLGDTDRYMFNYNGVDKYEETGAAIVIGTIEVSGYGKYYLGTENVTTNAVYATEIRDNIVDGFEATGELVINDNAAFDDMEGCYGDIEIVVPTRELTINVDFPNTIENNAYSYQQMKVTVSGGDLDEALVIELGDDYTIDLSAYTDKTGCAATAVFADGAYKVTLTKLLTKDVAYNVEVSGAGYRTARYTVTMQGEDTDGKVLNFWNNVKDNALEVEEGKATSAKTVTYLAGDIVKDSVINIYDLSAVVSYFGETELVGNNNTYAKYDLNRDGKIDSKDVAYVLVSWGK